MKISDHQPFLFGHEGYWSKIAAADLHVVMADVEYRPEDKLTTCVLSDTLSFAGMVRSSVDHPRIAAMELTKAKKLRASVEQLLMNKSMPHGDRLENFLPLLEDGRPYLEVWAGMARIVKEFAKIKTRWVISETPPPGATPFGRNLNRLAQLGIPNSGAEYICGPAIRYYIQRNDECPMPLLLHQMTVPSSVSFVKRIVEESAPTLTIPTLLPLSS